MAEQTYGHNYAGTIGADYATTMATNPGFSSADIATDKTGALAGFQSAHEDIAKAREGYWNAYGQMRDLENEFGFDPSQYYGSSQYDTVDTSDPYDFSKFVDMRQDIIRTNDRTPQSTEGASQFQIGQDIDNINTIPEINFDFKTANESLLKKQQEKEQFEQSMKDTKPVVTSEFERLQNTPGTKEYEEKQKHIKLGEGAAALGTREADIVRSAADQYVKMAGENVAGALVGGAFGKLLGKGFNLLPNNMKMGIAKVISKGADKALGQTLSRVGDKLLNASAPATQKVLGQVFDTVGRNVANLATGVGTTAASAGVVGTRDIDKDMWSNAIDNVGLGNTRLGQWMKEKLSSAPKTEEAQEQVAQELIDMVESDPTILQEVTEIVDVTPNPVDSTSESDLVESTPTTGSRLDAYNDMLQSPTGSTISNTTRDHTMTDREKDKYYQRIRQELSKDASSGTGIIDYVLSATTGNTIQDFKDIGSIIVGDFDKDAANTTAGQEYIAATQKFTEDWANGNFGQKMGALGTLLSAYKKATMDSAAGQYIQAFKNATKAAITAALNVAGVATGNIASIISMLLKGQVDGTALGEYLGGSEVPPEIVAELKDVFGTRTEAGTARSGMTNTGTNTYNKGLTAVSDEDCKKYIRTVVRGQPHVRAVANKLRS